MRSGTLLDSPLSQINDDRPLAVVSTFPPTQCGLATYAEDVIAAIRAVRPSQQFIRVAVTDSKKNESRIADFTISRAHPERWAQLSHWLSQQRVTAVLLQHEFKIFGGHDGCNVTRLFAQRAFPIVTTLHSVSRRLPAGRLEVISNICHSSDRVIVHSRDCKQILQHLGVNAGNVHVIPHGAPIVDFQWPENRKGSFRSRPLFISFGHLRRSKGYELALDAFARLRNDGIFFDYWIYGKNHPRRNSAGAYRDEIVALICKLGLEDRIRLIDEYLPVEDLIAAVRACDFGILPYRRIEQGSSGTLAFFLGCGRPVVCSNFRVAREIVHAKCGELFRVGDVRGLYRKLKKVASNAQLRSEMMLEAHSRAQEWTWDVVGRKYVEVISMVSRDSWGTVQMEGRPIARGTGSVALPGKIVSDDSDSAGKRKIDRCVERLR